MFYEEMKNMIEEVSEHTEKNPNHIAIIMDGNGRWAQQQGLKRSDGHEQGMANIRPIVKEALKEDIKVLTLFAFSTENWKRSMNEVRFIMGLPIRFFNDYMDDIMENNIQIKITGFPNRVPLKTKDAINKAIELTTNNTGLIVNIAFNYGGRAEITDAVRKIVQDTEKGKVKAKDIDEEFINQYLMTTEAAKPYEDVDLLIRTSGEERVSNFLLWQIAYSEFYFSDLPWPAFTAEEFRLAIASYRQRNRRFGGVEKEE